MNKENRITFRVSTEQHKSLIDMADNANMTLSGYIKYILLNNSKIQIVDRSSEIITQICNIETAINKLHINYSYSGYFSHSLVTSPRM